MAPGHASPPTSECSDAGPRAGLPLPRPLSPLPPLPREDSPVPGRAESWMSLSSASVYSGLGWDEASTLSVPQSKAARVPEVRFGCGPVSVQSVGGKGWPGAVFEDEFCSRTPSDFVEDGLNRVGPGVLVELRVEARGLLNKDRLSLSDPFAVLYAETLDRGMERIGQTETVYDNLNPKFVTRFLFRPRMLGFSTIQLELFDRDHRRSSKLSRHDFLGRAEFDIAKLLRSPSTRLDMELQRSAGATKGRTARGEVSVIGEVLADPMLCRGIAAPGSDGKPARAGVVVFRINCTALKKKGLNYRTRSVLQFFEIQRRRQEHRGGMSWTVVYRSGNGRKVNQDGFVEFKQTLIDENALHNGNPDRALRFVFYRRNIRSPHDIVCSAETTLTELTAPKLSASCGRRKIALSSEYQDYDYEGMGSMKTVGIRRYPENVLLVDVLVDIFMPKGLSALNTRCAQRKVVGGGIGGKIHNLVSLH